MRNYGSGNVVSLLNSEEKFHSKWASDDVDQVLARPDKFSDNCSLWLIIQFLLLVDTLIHLHNLSKFKDV